MVGAFCAPRAGVPAASADRGRAGLCTVRNRGGLTERYLTGPHGLRVVDRIVDRARRTDGCIMCTVCVPPCFSVQLRQSGRGGVAMVSGNGKEKVYGWIP